MDCKAASEVSSFRDYSFDNIKGLMIFLVVIGHATTILSNRSSHQLLMSFNLLINVIHMPTFAFVSGFFCTKYANDKSAKKSATNILLPFVLFDLLHWLLFSRSFSDLLTPQFTMWYLLSLFIWKNIIIPISELRFFLLGTVLLSLLIGITDIGGVLGIVRTTCYFPFFALGYLSSTNNTFDNIRKKIGGGV